MWAQRCIKNELDVGAGYVALCIALFKTGQYERMRDEASNAVLKFPNNARLYHLRAASYYGTSQTGAGKLNRYSNYDKAVKDETRACELDPQNASYQRTYAIYLILRDGSVDFSL